MNEDLNITAQEVLSSLFNADETVCLRVFADRKDDPFPGAKYAIECGKFATMEQTLENMNLMNRGVFYTVNYGGHSDQDITRINAQFVEMDHAGFEEQWERINAFPLAPSMVIRTRKSLHTYWFIRDGAVESFRKIQKQLVKHFGGDPACVNESRVMRLPGYNHCKQEPIPVACVLFHPERRYTQAQLSEALPLLEPEAPPERKKGTERGLRVVCHECDFIRHCRDDAKTLSEHDWYAMITNLAPFEGGTDMIHRLSREYPGYTEAETQKKINHFLDSGTRPITCRVIGEKGFVCPRMQDGSCACRAPAALSTKPMSVEGLRSLIGELTMSGDDMKDLNLLSQFVREYLYNQEPAIVEGLLNYELKDRFKLSANILKALSVEYRTVSKRYQAGLNAQKHRTEETLPIWYVPTDKGLRFLPGVLADHMAKEEQVFYAAQQHYLYQKGVYQEMTEMQARKMTRDKMISRETKMCQISDAEGQWRLNIQRSPHELNVNPYIINLKNGLYNVLEGTLSPHTPEYYSTIQLNVSYDPEATCPRFLQYLKEVLDEDQIPLIQEMLGYFLVPINKAQKCFVIVGEGGAGKSQLLLVINDVLLGPWNVSNVSWQSLNERFKPAELYGKLANVFADLPTKNIDDNGIFKALVGQDYLTVEKKNKNPFSFQCTARLLFSCNTIPANYGDRSEGFYRRLIIVRFDHPVPEEKRDVALLDKFRGEADGIFLFALEGLKRLIANQFRFSETEKNRQELQQYREDSDSVLSFVRDCCMADPGHETGSMELYNAYKGFCEECGMKAYSQRKFLQQVLLACPSLRHKRDKTGKRRILEGIRLEEM